MTLSAISLTTLSFVPRASEATIRHAFFRGFPTRSGTQAADHPREITPRPTPRRCLPSANGFGARLAAQPLRRPRQPNFHSAC
jgi:hypothetical protein